MSQPPTRQVTRYEPPGVTARVHRPLDAEARAVAGGDREDPEERAALVEEQHLAVDVDLDARGAAPGDERAGRARPWRAFAQHVVGGPAGAGQAVHLLEGDDRVGRVAVEHAVDRARRRSAGRPARCSRSSTVCTARAGPEPGRRLGRGLGRGRRGRRGGGAAVVVVGAAVVVVVATRAARGRVPRVVVLPPPEHAPTTMAAEHRDRQPAIVSGLSDKRASRGRNSMNEVGGGGRVTAAGELTDAVQLR